MSLSPAQIIFEQVVYGKRVVRPGGPIVPLDGYHHTGRSAGVGPELLRQCVPKVTGIGMKDINWHDYPWQEERFSVAVCFREAEGERWMAAVRECGLPETGVRHSRLYTHAQYLLVPAAQWRAEAFAPMLRQLTVEQMVEDRADLPTVEAPLRPDPLPLPPDWLERITPYLLAVLAGMNVALESRAAPVEFLETLQICLAALPDALACRLPVGMALGVADEQFAIAHALRARTDVHIRERAGGPMDVRGLSDEARAQGQRYLDWLRARTEGLATAGELHNRVQEGWSAYAAASSVPADQSWRDVARRIAGDLHETLWTDDLRAALAAGRPLPLPMQRIERRRGEVLGLLLPHWEMPAVQDLLVQTLGWEEGWRRVAGLAPSDDGEAGALAAFAGHAPLQPAHVATLAGRPLQGQLAGVCVDALYRALKTAGNPDAWLDGLPAGGSGGWLDVSRTSLQKAWTDLIMRDRPNPAKLRERMRRLGARGPLGALIPADRPPTFDAYADFAGALHGANLRTEEVAEEVATLLDERGSALGVVLFADAFARSPAVLRPAEPGVFASRLLREIKDWDERGFDARMPSGGVAALLLNHTQEEEWPPAVGTMLRDSLGPVADVILYPNQKTPPPPLTQTVLDLLCACVDAAPASRLGLWENVLLRLLNPQTRNLPVVSKIKQCLERDSLELWRERPELACYARHLGMAVRGSPTAGEPPPDPAERQRTFLLLRDSPPLASPVAVPSDADAWELLLALTHANTARSPQSFTDDQISRVLDALMATGDRNLWEAWQSELQRAVRTDTLRWRLIGRLATWRLSQPFMGLEREGGMREETEIFAAVNARVLVGLALSGVAVWYMHLNDIVPMLLDPNPPPPAARPEETGVVYLRRASRSEEPPMPMRLHYPQLLTLAEQARQAKCFDLLNRLWQFAESAYRKDPSPSRASLLSALVGRDNTESYEQLRKKIAKWL